MIVAAAMPLLAVDSNSVVDNGPHPGPGLTWKKINQGGGETIETELADKTRPAVAKINVVKQDGSTVQRVLYGLDVKRFRGSAVHYAILPASVRQKPTFVDFILSGTVGSEPDSGSVINVDGAILGFQFAKAGSAQKPTYRAQAVYMDADANGNKRWKPTGYSTFIMPGQEMDGAAKLGIRLDYVHHRWAFYRSDILVKDNLPLFSQNGPPKISLRAGLLDTDVLALEELKISDKPYSRPDIYLPAVNGKIDIAKAKREHDPRLHPPGVKNFMEPNH